LKRKRNCVPLGIRSFLKGLCPFKPRFRDKSLETPIFRPSGGEIIWIEDGILGKRMK
jgi:hypothetical protein